MRGMFKQVVVGTDGSSRARAAVDAAVAVARGDGATLHLVHAVKLPSRSAIGSPELAGVVVTADADAERAAHELLAGLRDECRDVGVECHVHVSPKPAAEALCSVATEVGADVIVVGNKGMKGMSRVLGSVPNAVAHKATCAVLIVPTG
jgi:nucleotide-binding universal stress UspA family protein